MDDEYLDFVEHEEVAEDLDFDDPIECPHCRNMIPKDSFLCLYCGSSVSVGKRASWLKIVAGILVFIFILFLIRNL
ncbi:MAG: zinc ribbon domain-containing protein [Candidatus Kaelpia aquatica]|nr:zinc ribbon domain-containing protein [Candidatus Kaelpia aquatica]